MPSLVQKAKKAYGGAVEKWKERNYMQCISCMEHLPPKSWSNLKDFNLGRNPHAVSMPVCKGCEIIWKDKREQEGEKVICPACRGMSFAPGEIEKAMGLDRLFMRFGKKKRKVYMGPKGGLYYKVNGKKIYIRT